MIPERNVCVTVVGDIRTEEGGVPRAIVNGGRIS